MNNIQRTLEHAETTVLNPASHFPLISTITGICRAVLGVAQVAIGGLAVFFATLTGNLKHEYYGKHHFTHGIMNLARACVEVIPGVNVLCSLYDDSFFSEEALKKTNGVRQYPEKDRGRFAYISYDKYLEV